MKHYLSYHAGQPAFLNDFLLTAPLSRLAGVGMNCGCEYTSFPLFSGLKPYSRLDHSLGCALIVWHFTSDKAQTLSALFHDIASPVFSHVIDFMKGDHLRQEATESGTEELIVSSEALTGLLRREGLRPDEVSDYHRYPIADNPSPALSADRLEYTLGNLLNYRLASPEAVAGLYADLCAASDEKGTPELCFRHADKALLFAGLALRCSQIYTSPEDRFAMQTLAGLIRDALAEGILSEDDLYRTEPELIARLRAQPGTRARWTAFTELSAVCVQDAPGPEPGWLRIPAKKRCIDPLIAGEGRTSELFPDFADSLRAYLDVPQNEWIRKKG